MAKIPSPTFPITISPFHIFTLSHFQTFKWWRWWWIKPFPAVGNISSPERLNQTRAMQNAKCNAMQNSMQNSMQCKAKLNVMQQHMISSKEAVVHQITPTLCIILMIHILCVLISSVSICRLAVWNWSDDHIYDEIWSYYDDDVSINATDLITMLYLWWLPYLWWPYLWWSYLGKAPRTISPVFL